MFFGLSGRNITRPKVEGKRKSENIMSCGKWIMNAEPGCTIICGLAVSLNSKLMCPHCVPNYLNDKEIGPPAPTTVYPTPADALKSGQIGIYEKVIGPTGMWGLGFNIPTVPVGIGATHFPHINTPSIGQIVSKLKQVKNSITSEDKQVECRCSSRDLWTFGHRCGRKAPIDLNWVTLGDEK